METSPGQNRMAEAEAIVDRRVAGAAAGGAKGAAEREGEGDEEGGGGGEGVDG